jgi:hypothetical protein
MSKKKQEAAMVKEYETGKQKYEKQYERFAREVHQCHEEFRKWMLEVEARLDARKKLLDRREEFFSRHQSKRRAG